MCDYCEYEKQLENDSEFLEVTINDGRICLDEPREDFWGRIEREIRINYCPMCGESLSEPNPLTIEELQALSNIPIWVCLNCEKDLWCVWDGSVANIPGCDHWWYELNDYGKTWVAYRHRPMEA